MDGQKGQETWEIVWSLFEEKNPSGDLSENPSTAFQKAIGPQGVMVAYFSFFLRHGGPPRT